MLQQVVKLLACAVLLKVTAGVIVGYGDYLPPNFEAGFLAGREAYFWHGYHWAFYLHLVAGPSSLVVGTVLMSKRFRLQFPSWHRYLGRFQIVCVLLLISPTGIWMATYAEPGAVAGLGFASLAVATGLCAVLGWRNAVRRRFAREYLLWLQRIRHNLHAPLHTRPLYND